MRQDKVYDRGGLPLSFFIFCDIMIACHLFEKMYCFVGHVIMTACKPLERGEHNAEKAVCVGDGAP